MKDFKYVYECPTKRGYIKFKISKKDHNEIFKYRKTVWHSNYEYYVKDNHIIMQLIPTKLVCMLSTLFYPVAVLFHGSCNYKEIYTDSVTKCWCIKKYGSFSRDEIHKREGDDTFERIMRCRK